MSTTPSFSTSVAALPDANFLASSFSFSTLVDSNDTQRTVYTFGGMCPTGTTSNETTWQSQATYSNDMVKLSYSSPTSYLLSLSTSSGNGPIAEAGFTITALQPTFSNSSTGLMTQAQNYVLLGGHTNAAFTNMSQVALFSLPQESWSFQNIDSTAKTGSTELAVKSTSGTTMTTPDSRSGHTAMLSLDGSSIIVFGGWVGDVKTPADPQLAILRIGSGFGGSGNWAWDLPNSKGSGLAAGEGIYGHGAVMLPGNVMMVVGGYRIGAPSSSKLLTRSNSAVNALFLNATSMTWVSNYTNPGYAPFSAASPATSSSSDKASKARNVGLGAGLGLGLAALLGALIFYLWYSRRLKKRKRDAREKDLQQLSRSAVDIYSIHGSRPTLNRGPEDTGFGLENGDMVQGESFIPLPGANSLGNRSMGIGRGVNGGYTPIAYGSTGGYGDYDQSAWLPNRTNSNRSGPSIPRKPINPRNARGYYQPTSASGSSQSYSGFDFGTGHSRANSLSTAGAIHPIYEADEEHDTADGQQQNLDGNADSGVGNSIVGLDADPFLDPQRSSLVPSSQGSRPGTGLDQHRDRSTPTPESAAQEREREVKEWVADWTAAEALMQSRAQSLTYGGRISPSKESGSGRTASNLSERSAISALTLSRSGSVKNNTLTAFFASGPSTWLRPLTDHGNGGDVSPISEKSSGHGKSHGANPPPSAGSGSSSFTTAQTSQSFSTLRAEAENLISRPSPEGYASEGSPSKAKAAAFTRRQQGGWLGSLKRVFVGAEDESLSINDSARSSPTRGHRSPSFTGSPTRAYHDQDSPAQHGPRRAVSATATMWRRKQGKDDWQDSAEPQNTRSNTLTLDGSYRPVFSEDESDGVRGISPDHGVEDEEWDIERAVERRVVQVMFTVPKEKLRVVNQDVEEDRSETGDGSRKGSLEGSSKDLGEVGKDDGKTSKERTEETAAETDKYEAHRGYDETPSRTSTPSNSVSLPGSPGKAKGKRVAQIVERLEARSGSPVSR